MTVERDDLRESEPDADVLQQLASAWRAMTPPDPTAAVDAPDEATRATIAWMQSAWRATASASASPIEDSKPRALPWRLRVEVARRRVVPMAPWFAVAAGAAAAFVAAITFLGGDGALAPVHGPSELVSKLPDPHDPVAPLRADATSTTPTPAPTPQLVSLTADRMELRSGPVRLILFTPSPESNP